MKQIFCFISMFTVMGLWVGCTNNYSLSPITSSSSASTATPTSNSVTVYTFAGTGTQGYLDGTLTTAEFNRPAGVALNTSGNVYVTDNGNNVIRKIATNGTVSTLAGQLSGASGNANGIGTAASFYSPVGIASDSSGNLFVADQYNNLIRKIDTAGNVSTFAGSGTPGFTNGTGTGASFHYPYGLAIDSLNNVYVADSYNQVIRKITPGGVVSTFAGSGTAGYLDGTGTAAEFYNAIGLAVDASNNVYVADTSNERIRRITPAGVVTTIAGSGAIGSYNGVGTTATFFEPVALTFDSSGNLFISDQVNEMMREMSPAYAVSTYAGQTLSGYVNGPASSAKFNYPIGIAMAAAEYLYVADCQNNVIRVIY